MILMRVVFEMKKKERKVLLSFMVVRDVCSFSNISHTKVEFGKDHEENLRVKLNEAHVDRKL